ncbi:MAG: 2-hydroxyacid dehydrogenase [Gammaproteobacteria bacterium]|nr:2-hydroxyacid dehydrogenase [Gammaproteobacteria bacterium]NNC98187.1 2-hydroxyacid dehydrogenase [Gammaproteobacteria bacterium]NNM14865.1 2-hydroxyacid dehydrogenase [Gammaproteobacteria bacterium]
MQIAMFSVKAYDSQFFEQENASHQHTLNYFNARLDLKTAHLAKNCDAVCAFVNDVLDRPVLQVLKDHGIGIIALRCAGFNNLDLQAARDLEMLVVRVPEYSPWAVAEHALSLIQTLNRKTHRAFNRVREGNFSLDGLLGFDLHGKTIGIIGTGKIGSIFARIMHGFGTQVIACDPVQHPDCLKLGVNYLELDKVLQHSDIISMHCPLNSETRHLVDANAIAKMKTGVMLINTGRGALVDSKALIGGLKSQKIGFLGLDVYEEEAELFFEDLSDQVIQDDVFMRLMTFPNVLITGHQGFFTDTAMQNIAKTTLDNLDFIEANGHCRDLDGQI